MAASSSKSLTADSLSLATRYSLLRGRHLSMEQYWNERHNNDQKHISELENRNSALIGMLEISQNELNNLKRRITLMETNNNQETELASDLNMELHPPNIDLNMEYTSLMNTNMNRSMKTHAVLYELLRECLFLSDPYNIRVLVKRLKTKHTNTTKKAKSDGFNAVSKSFCNILSFRKQSDYECDCFAIYYAQMCSYSTRLILMRNSLIICGIAIASSFCDIQIELYTIAGISISNNDPCSHCNSMIIACCKDLTVAAHGINPLDPDDDNHGNVIRYEFNIFSDAKKLIHALTERLPDYVWHSRSNKSKISNKKTHTHTSSSSSMVGRLSAGIYAGITGVVMDPIRGGQNHGMKGFLRGIASGISGVAMKPITHFRSGTDENIRVLSPPIVHNNIDGTGIDREEKERKLDDIRSALVIPDSPTIFQAESMSESASIASSTITTNTLDSSKSGHSTCNDHHQSHQSQIFVKHKMMQRQQYLSTIDSKKQSEVDHTLPIDDKKHDK